MFFNAILTFFWLLQNLEKREKSNKFNRLQIEVFFFPNINPSTSPTPKHRPIKFVVCLDIRTGCIDVILRYFTRTKLCDRSIQDRKILIVNVIFPFYLLSLRLEGEDTLQYRCVCRPPFRRV